jgi:hypothetical protein
MSAKTGRPKSEGPIRSETIPIKVYPEEKRQIKATAKRAGVSVSDYCRLTITEKVSLTRPLDLPVLAPDRPAEQLEGRRAYVLYEQDKKVPAPGTKNQAISFELTTAEAESRNRQLESEGSLRRYAEKQ